MNIRNIGRALTRLYERVKQRVQVQQKPTAAELPQRSEERQWDGMLPCGHNGGRWISRMNLQCSTCGAVYRWSPLRGLRRAPQKAQPRQLRLVYLRHRRPVASSRHAGRRDYRPWRRKRREMQHASRKRNRA